MLLLGGSGVLVQTAQLRAELHGAASHNKAHPNPDPNPNPNPNHNPNPNPNPNKARTTWRRSRPARTPPSYSASRLR